jgi:hypothetical protein
MEWAPEGFFTGFSVQIATSPDFTSPVLDTSLSYTTIMDFHQAEENTTYYWRVKTRNESQEGAWSDSSIFITSPPTIQVVAPLQADEWQVGLDYWIKWDDNINEDVILELHNNGSFNSVIDTTASTGAIKWSIPVNQEPGDQYTLVIKSLTDDDLQGVSEVFSLIDTVTSISANPVDKPNFKVFPNPASDRITIEYELPVYERVRINFYDLTGRLIRTTDHGFQSPGKHRVDYELGSLKNSIYIVELHTGTRLLRETLLRLDLQ